MRHNIRISFHNIMVVLTINITGAVVGSGSGDILEPVTIGIPTSITMSGDVAGASNNTTVVGLRGRNVVATQPTDGQSLVWVAADNSWEPLSTVGNIINWNVTTQHSNYTITNSDAVILGDTSKKSLTFTLPKSPAKGRVYIIRNISNANVLHVSGNGILIDGNKTPLQMNNSNVSYAVIFDGSQWRIITSYI